MNKVLGFEALADNVVEQEQHAACLATQDMIHDFEVIVVVEDVEVVDDIFIGDVLAAETHHLVEDGKGVAQGAVGFLGNDVKGFGFGLYAFALGHESQMFGDVVDGDALEVEDLATRQDGGDNLVLLCGGQDELGIRRRLFQRLQEGIEGILA